MERAIVPPINILKFASLSAFLREYYAVAKVLDKTFSYEKWKRYLGAKNRSYLQLVVSGKRKVNDEYIALFLKYFSFTKSERAHFIDLADLSQMRSSRQRQSLRKKIEKRIEFSEERVLHHYESFIKNTKLMALMGYFGFTDIRADAKTLARLLKEPIDKVEEWLSTLQNLELIAYDSIEGVWKSRQAMVVVRPKAGVTRESERKLLLERHVANLELGAKNIQTRPHDECEYQGAVLMLSKSELSEFHLRLREFAHDLYNEYLFDTLGNKQPHMLQWVIFPLI